MIKAGAITITMAARNTLEDHRFSGNALEDFGITEEDIEMNGLLDECLRSNISSGLLEECLQSHASTEEEEKEEDEQSTKTVKMSNLQSNRRQKSAMPPSPISESNGSSTDGSTYLSSFEDDDDKNGKSMDAFALRVMIAIGVVIIGLSIMVVFLLWRVMPYFDTAEGMVMDHPEGDFLGMVEYPPTISPSRALEVEPADLFTETGEPALKCPNPMRKAAPLQGKKGTVAQTDENDRIRLDKILELDPYWSYSGNPERPKNQPDFLDFLPMVQHGDEYPDISRTILDLLEEKPDYYERILGFNKPDDEGPNILTVETAINRWELLDEMNVPMVSPSAIDPAGSWMQDFMQGVDKKCLRVDWIAVHWHGGKSLHNFQTKMKQIHSMYGNRPLLLTEFSVVDGKTQYHEFNRITEKDVLGFMKQALPWLQTQDWIAGYAWSGEGPSALFDERGELTAVGKFYASVRQDNPLGNQNIVL